MPEESLLVAQFENYQSGCWLDEYLERCTRLKAVYYIASEAFPVVTKDDAVKRKKSELIRSMYFIVQRVKDGLLRPKKSLFLKLTLQGADLAHTEAEKTQAIAKKSPTKTPNIVNIEGVLWWVDKKMRLTAIVMGKGMEFKTQLNNVIKSCKDGRELEIMMLSALFQLIHGLVTLHWMHFQHRDLKIENIIGVSSVSARVIYHQYRIKGQYFHVPIASSVGFVMWPRWIDFGLTGNLEVEDDVTECLNNIDFMLPPDFVFFCPDDHPEYHNSDDYFSCALGIACAIFDDFNLGDVDDGILNHVAGMFSEMVENGSDWILHHLEPRNLKTVAKQAFRLVLFLGFPAENEWHHFYQSMIGRYLSANIRSYIEGMVGYNFLQQRLADPACKFKSSLTLLASLLRWNRAARPSCGADVLMRPEFAPFRREERDPLRPTYDWDNWES
jgi:serine/threonine protein kinase